MKYDYYPLLMDSMEKAIRKKFHITKKEKRKGKAAYEDAMTILYNSDMGERLLPSMDTIVMMEENQWLNNSERNVIFPASVDLLKSLYEAKCDFKSMAHFQLPHDIFMLAMPKGFEIEGHEIKAMMVSYYAPDERAQVLQNFANLASLGKVNMSRDDEYGDDKTLAINYFAESNESDEKQIPLFRICIPESELLPVMNAQSFCEYRQILGKFDKFDYKHLSYESDQDSHLQFIAARIVLMLGVYYASFPEAVSSGYPDAKEPKKLVPLNHRNWKKETIGKHLNGQKREQTDGRKMHYRRWHFRQLMNERYYKGEHKAKPIGSRVIFVRDTSVGADITPETLNQKESG